MRTTANCHTKLANRLINLARTMKPSSNVATENDRQIVTGKTMKPYLDLATKCSKKKTLTDEQKRISKASWKGKRDKKSKKVAPSDNLKEASWDDTFDEIQRFGKEAQELLELTEQCDLCNVIHSGSESQRGS